MAAFSSDAFDALAFSDQSFAFGVGPTPVVRVDTHDGFDGHHKKYRKEAEARAEIRKMLERLIDGPVLPELVEEAAAEVSEPTVDALTEWVKELDMRTAERRRDEEDEEEFLAMAAL